MWPSAIRECAKSRSLLPAACRVDAPSTEGWSRLAGLVAADFGLTPFCPSDGECPSSGTGSVCETFGVSLSVVALGIWILPRSSTRSNVLADTPRMHNREGEDYAPDRPPIRVSFGSLGGCSFLIPKHQAVHSLVDRDQIQTRGVERVFSRRAAFPGICCSSSIYPAFGPGNQRTCSREDGGRDLATADFVVEARKGSVGRFMYVARLGATRFGPLYQLPPQPMPLRI